MTIAVLALQGAFAEHEKMIRSLGADCIELRQAEDLKKHYDGLILPGGESTVQGKLLRELGMFDTIKKQIEDGLPVLATCAGMILLASAIDGQIAGQPDSYFGTLPVRVRRNAYGRQLASFHAKADVAGIGAVPGDGPVPDPHRVGHGRRGKGRVYPAEGGGVSVSGD